MNLSKEEITLKTKVLRLLYSSCISESNRGEDDHAVDAILHTKACLRWLDCSFTFFLNKNTENEKDLIRPLQEWYKNIGINTQFKNDKLYIDMFS